MRSKKQFKKKIKNDEEEFNIDGDMTKFLELWTITLKIYFRAQKKY